LLCIYTWMISVNRLDDADEIYMRWEHIFQSYKVDRHGGASKKTIKERLLTSKDPLPTAGQLAIIKGLAAKKGVDPPKVLTASEATDVINALKRA
jgi:hypothetical protein